MTGPEYFTVAGYFADGAILCCECGDKQALPASDQFTQVEAGVSYGDTGLYCDSCGAEIVSSPEEEENEDERD